MSAATTNPVPATGNTAPGLTSVTIILFIWAALTYTWRTWVKTKFKRSDAWGLDDSAITLSLLFIIAHLITICFSVSHGYGNDWPVLASSDADTIEKALFAGQITYVLSMGFTRLSTCFFTVRLSRERKYKPLTNTWTGLCAAWTVASVVAIAVRGDMAQPWATLDGTQTMFIRWLGVEVTGLVLDVGLCATSCFLIWALHMPALKRISVSMVFLARILIAPFVGFRLSQLAPSQNPDTNKPDLLATMMTEACMNIAFVLASVTCLKAFLRPFGAGFLVSVSDTAPTGYRTRGRAGKGSTYYMLSGAREKNETKTTAIVSVAERDVSLATLPKAVVAREKGGHHITVAPQTRRQHINSNDSKEQMIISKTDTWTVEYEYDDDSPHEAGRAI